jgi:hypothetical protein
MRGIAEQAAQCHPSFQESSAGQFAGNLYTTGRFDLGMRIPDS